MFCLAKILSLEVPFLFKLFQLYTMLHVAHYKNRTLHPYININPQPCKPKIQFKIHNKSTNNKNRCKQSKQFNTRESVALHQTNKPIKIPSNANS